MSSSRLASTLAGIATMLLVMLPPESRADFDIAVPMTRSSGGNFDVLASFGSHPPAPFLVDTGAGLTTISTELFRSLNRVSDLRPIRRVAALLANGRTQVMDVYLITDFRLGDQCALGSVEVAVVANGGRNILGMSALSKAAPFGLDLAPPALLVSACGGDLELAATF